MTDKIRTFMNLRGGCYRPWNDCLICKRQIIGDESVVHYVNPTLKDKWGNNGVSPTFLNERAHSGCHIRNIGGWVKIEKRKR